MLIDYISQSDSIANKRVLELGCGWGVTGIYCAKKHHALVTCVDLDNEVYPYLNLTAKTNKVEVDFLNLGIDQIKRGILKDIDIIIGSDICFCDTLIDPLRRLFNRG